MCSASQSTLRRFFDGSVKLPPHWVFVWTNFGSSGHGSLFVSIAKRLFWFLTSQNCFVMSFTFSVRTLFVWTKALFVCRNEYIAWSCCWIFVLYSSALLIADVNLSCKRPTSRENSFRTLSISFSFFSMVECPAWMSPIPCMPESGAAVKAGI